MTLKGQNNYFNVKFLKGYGFSINVKDSKIILKDNHDPFSEGTTEEWFIKNIQYQGPNLMELVDHTKANLMLKKMQSGEQKFNFTPWRVLCLNLWLKNIR